MLGKTAARHDEKQPPRHEDHDAGTTDARRDQNKLSLRVLRTFVIFVVVLS
jgi:hypothetical protein